MHVSSIKAAQEPNSRIGDCPNTCHVGPYVSNAGPTGILRAKSIIYIRKLIRSFSDAKRKRKRLSTTPGAVSARPNDTGQIAKRRPTHVLSMHRVGRYLSFGHTKAHLGSINRCKTVVAESRERLGVLIQRTVFACSIVPIASEFHMQLADGFGRNRFLWFGPERGALYLLALVAMSRCTEGDRNRSML